MKRVDKAFEGVGVASASEFMLNLFSKHMCDPFGDHGVCVSLKGANKSGRCSTWGRRAWQGSDLRSSCVLFWGVSTFIL